MRNILDILRNDAAWCQSEDELRETLRMGADEIERLHRELSTARRTALLEAAEIAQTGDWYGQFQTSGDERLSKSIADRIRKLAEEKPE